MTSESVTLSFADPGRELYGFASNARLAALFRGRELVGVSDEAELTMTLDAELARWTVGWEGAGCGFDVVASAVSAPIDHEGGSEWLVRVEGTVRVGAEATTVDALGQVSSSSAESPASVVRSVGVWFGEGGVVLESAGEHGGDDVWAALVEDGAHAAVVDPRLSTTYDGDGHQRRAGLELWMTEEGGYPVRVAGEVICGSSLDLDGQQLDLAFFRWRSNGAEGAGQYHVLRRP